MNLRRIKKTMKRVFAYRQGPVSRTTQSTAARTIGQCLALVPAGVLASGVALASPQGGSIVGGTGTIQQSSATHTLVTQQTQKMVIDWQTFNLAVGDTVRFDQPSVSATVLNRIFDQNPSQIFGAIQANGRVFLSNPNGIIFGESATVNVGSLMATTLNVDVDDFMNEGPYAWGNVNGSAGGAIVNRGLINAATGGSVTLVGGSVSNEGVIQATLGHVNLASGRTAVLDFDGDGLVSFAVDGEVLANTIGAASSVANTGTVLADGGEVLLAGHAAQDVFSNVVNNQGIIQANSIDTSNGTIRLVGGESGIVANSGTLRAAGDDVGEKGGTVQMLGEQVGLFDQGFIDVSGNAGGGTALVGGDFQGNNPEIRNASNTYVGPDASIDASATGNGDGGKVIVWGTDSLAVHGAIRARGGAADGDGGFVETSSHGAFSVTQAPDIGATHGKGGLWLIDPLDLLIDNTEDANVGGDGSAGNPFIPSGNHAHITWATIDAGLSGGDVIVTTVGSPDLGGNNGDITIGADGTLSSGNELTISAARDLHIDNNITRNETGNLVLTAARDLSLGADISLFGASTLGLNFARTLDLTSNPTLTAASGIAANGGGTGTIAGPDSANDWTVSAANTGSLVNAKGTVNFLGVVELTGGTGADRLTVTRDANITLTDNLLNVGAEAGLALGSIDAAVLTGGASANTIDASGWTGTRTASIFATAGGDTVTGNGANTTLTGQDGANAWSITAARTGTLSSGGATTSFSGVRTIAGGTGIDILTGRNADNNWSITGVHTATIDDMTATNMESLVGGILTDTFTVTSGVNFVGTIDGGTGTNSLLANDGTNTWAVTGTNTGTLNSTTTFSNITSLTGGSGNDRFTLGSEVASFVGTIAGGTGANSLIATDGINAWAVTGANSGTLNGTTGFSNIENLTGGTGNDTFVFASAGRLSGNLVGGQTTSDTLNLSGKIDAVAINQQTGTATGIDGIFSGIEAVVGNGASTTLTGSNTGETFTLTGADTGTAGSLSFTDVGNLVGGSGDDTYVGNVGSSLSGSIVDAIPVGGGGSTTLNGVLTTNGMQLDGDTITIHADINAGSGDVFLRAAHGDINNREPVKYTLKTNGTLSVTTSDLLGKINLNLNVPGDFYLETKSTITLEGTYNLAHVHKPVGVSIINAVFDSVLGSEMVSKNDKIYYIDPALFNQQLALFTPKDQGLRMPEDQLEEVLGKYTNPPWYRIAAVSWRIEDAGDNRVVTMNP